MFEALVSVESADGARVGSLWVALPPTGAPRTVMGSIGNLVLANCYYTSKVVCIVLLAMSFSWLLPLCLCV
jgi:hypothetical protein